MGPDPKPEQTIGRFNADSPMMQADTH